MSEPSQPAASNEFSNLALSGFCSHLLVPFMLEFDSKYDSLTFHLKRLQSLSLPHRHHPHLPYNSFPLGHTNLPTFWTHQCTLPSPSRCILSYACRIILLSLCCTFATLPSLRSYASAASFLYS